jgi:hypothetical protein
VPSTAVAATWNGRSARASRRRRGGRCRRADRTRHRRRQPLGQRALGGGLPVRAQIARGVGAGERARPGPGLGAQQRLELAAGAVEHQQPVGDAHRERQIVGDHDGRGAALVALLAHQPGQAIDAVGIQPDRGLVEEQHAASARQRARDRQALALTARQLGHRRAVGQLDREIDVAQPAAHRGRHLAGAGGRRR